MNMDPPVLPYLPTINQQINQPVNFMYPVDYNYYFQNNYQEPQVPIPYHYNTVASSSGANNSTSATVAAANGISNAMNTLNNGFSNQANLNVNINMSGNVSNKDQSYHIHSITQQYIPSLSYPPHVFLEKISNSLPIPPLSKVPNRPSIYQHLNQKLSKRKSKFTKVQDDLIVKLKQEGKNWVEIAEITKVGSYLAARNRYQVIIGQQGNNNSSSWNNGYTNLLKTLLDKYEIEKWRFICDELNKATNKDFKVEELQKIIQTLFMANPYNFNLNDDLINELEKEKRMTEKAVESLKNNDIEVFLNYDFQHQ